MRLLAAGLTLVFVAAACAGEASPAGSPGASGSPGPSPEPSPSLEIMASFDPESLCQHIDDLELAVARLRGIELKLINRTALDIEFDTVEMAFDEVWTAELGVFEEELEAPLQRLFYRLGELELAIEDFRTNSRPRRAAPHVEEDATTFATDLAAFRVLARC